MGHVTLSICTPLSTVTKRTPGSLYAADIGATAGHALQQQQQQRLRGLIRLPGAGCIGAGRTVEHEQDRRLACAGTAGEKRAGSRETWNHVSYSTFQITDHRPQTKANHLS